MAIEIQDLFALAPQILPLLPRLSKAVTTFERLQGDADVKDAIAVIEDVATIFQQYQSDLAKRGIKL